MSQKARHTTLFFFNVGYTCFCVEVNATAKIVQEELKEFTPNSHMKCSIIERLESGGAPTGVESNLHVSRANFRSASGWSETVQLFKRC